MKALTTLLCTLPLLAVASCEATEYATPTEKEALVALDGQITAAEKVVAEKEAAAKKLLKEAETLGKEALAATTAADKLAVEAKMVDLLMRLDVARGEWQVALNQLDTVGQQAAQIEANIAARQTQLVSDGFGVFSPQAGLIASLTVPLLLRLGFKRSRQHLGDSLKRMAKLGLGDSISYLAKAYGFTHTTEQWEELLERSVAAARAAGDDDKLAELKAFQERMLAKQAA